MASPQVDESPEGAEKRRQATAAELREHADFERRLALYYERIAKLTTRKAHERLAIKAIPR